MEKRLMSIGERKGGMEKKLTKIGVMGIKKDKWREWRGMENKIMRI